MRLATVRTAGGTRAAKVTGGGYVDLGLPDVGALLAHEDWPELAARADGPALQAGDLAPVVPRPGKILCVGLNYRTHILEMGRELPDHPTLFAKFAEALIGPRDDVQLAPESSAVDWEAELALVIGATVRRASPEEAAAAIAGFTVMNDVTMRDWQFRTKEWLQGKTFEGTTPLGPVLVTPDELPGGVRPALPIRCLVDGEQTQLADTADLVFDPVDLVRYASTIMTLRPGDVIATGTPGGVGHARTPPRYLTDGVTLVTEVEGVGRLENTARTA
ncbi:FAA hydrolase family protein [Nonomuraea deserti]|uniref:FAA hydrolase family protein n=1 Tax=Nonomuraea deserti TaxID=1848322 RepID=A0A4R4VJ70_9ACTN|nr:fumarylacetoacetate hydrolase family protein [Nonomuraea deserti]TDD02853.1 FAA hydrolase family protein [Nonomuraea deserti]